MKKGTLACSLFGHKFHGKKLEYHPHYLDLVKKGIATFATSHDMYLVGFQSDYCVRCGAENLSAN